LDKKIDWDKKKKQVVVALPIENKEAREVLLMLNRVFRDKDICSFVIRSHPASSIEDVIKSIDFEFTDDKFALDNKTPLGDLLISSRAVIIVGSSASIDAVACQCPVIIPWLSYRVDTNPLSKVSEDLVTCVASEDELVDTIQLIINSKNSPVEFDKCKLFVNDYFTIHNDKKEYFTRFKSLLK